MLKSYKNISNDVWTMSDDEEYLVRQRLSSERMIADKSFALFLFW